jgi:H+/Cl- antiporter ClcA
LLGNELALRLLEYEIPTPLRELPVYLLLGATSGLCAVLFIQTTKVFKAVFDGELGPRSLKDAFDSIPDYVKPAIGGLTCGLIGYFFPPILFFGYETLNGLLMNNRLETTVAISLLLAKIGATAISAASGLVGGTLAPTLFMGGMVGLTFHNLLVGSLDISIFPGLSTIDAAFGTPFQIADLPAYTMVGAASFLAAVFRAPLTASLLAFELTKNYDVLVPLLASAGVGTLFCDLIETRLEQRN